MKRFLKLDEPSLDDILPVKRNIFSIGKDIFFYDTIDEETHAILVQKLFEARDYIIKMQAETILSTGGMDEAITIHINSPGGLVDDSLAIYDLIQNFPLPIIGIVEGKACSGASIMLCACAYRLMTEHSTILCHELSGVAFGKYSSLIDSHISNEMFMKMIKKIYRKHTKISEKDLDEILKHDIYWDADQCLQFGLVDSVVGRELDDEDVEIDAKTKKSKTTKKSTKTKSESKTENKTTKKKSPPAEG